MNIKYGELTIIYHKETNMFTNFLSWLDYFDEIPPKTSKFIFLFNDGEICDSNDKFIDFNFKFFNSVLSPPPFYFEKMKNDNKNDNEIYFLKDAIKKNYNCSIDFNELFSSYSKFNSSMNIKSNYNCIYYCYEMLLKLEIFAIIRIKSKNDMPRYQFAYDSNKFTKDEIIYLIHKIFKE